MTEANFPIAKKGLNHAVRVVGRMDNDPSVDDADMELNSTHEDSYEKSSLLQSPTCTHPNVSRPVHPESKYSMNLNFRSLKHVFLPSIAIISILLFLNLSAIHLVQPHDCTHPSEHNQARRESLGFFTDMRSGDWIKLKQRVKERQNHANADGTSDTDKPNVWYQENYEPDFTCLHERRIGGMGDGPKWVCDPHRINKNDCLVYSFGSNGDFTFEMGVLKHISPDCEIHTFDPNGAFRDAVPKEADDKIIFHAYGLANVETIVNEGGEAAEVYKTLPQIVKELKHEGRTIDLFKIDCEKYTYRDWFRSDAMLRQILVEVHEVAPTTNGFFQTLQREGYVVFHKEPNTMGCLGACVEYAFLKLGSSFFK